MAETDSVRPKKKLSRDDYTIGWICALSIELAASAGMLDDVHEDIGLARGDKNMYTLGEIAGHNIVIACLPEGSMGIVPAATVASNLLRSFPKIRFGLMVGIGGGAPARRARPSEDVRLGDVVVSIPQKELGGVIKYDRGKLVAGGAFEHTGLLNMPPSPLTSAVSKLRSMHESKRNAISRYVASMISKVMESEDANPEFEDQYRCPDLKYDQLFEADYEHVESKETEAKENAEKEEEEEDDEPLSDEDGDEIPLPCLHCDKSRLVARKPRKFPGPVVHYGTIASADQVMRHGASREKIRKQYGVLCFEMEAAGLMNDFPCLVIRGICDYSDTHKHKIWQRYAAATAAAYTKELLHVVLKEDIESTEEAVRVLERVEQGINDIGDGVEYLVKERQQESRDRILNWLDRDTHTKRFFDSYEKWQPSTVKKLLASEQYSNWSSGDCQTLWCPGIAGGGKTIFASVVMDSLKVAQAKKTDRKSRAGLACLFIEYERQKEQTVRSLTAAILRQLSEQCEALPEPVVSLFDEYESSASHIRFEDMALALTNILREFPEVYLIVDALDECAENTRRELLAHLSDQQRKTGLKILATSRPTIDFRKDFGPCEEMEVKADVLDVKTVLDLLIDKSDSLVKADEELRHRVTKSIGVAVDGMFLLVQPFLDSIIGERSRGHIEDALNTLIESPDKLTTVYQGALNRIGGQKLGDRKLAYRMLSWVVQSKRPLTRQEFLHALAVKAGSPNLQRDYIIHDLDSAVALCAGLVVINQRSDTVQLMHHTTRTYFEDPGHRPEWMGESEEMIASACITYVSFTVFEDGPCEYDEDLDERLIKYPFLPYAAQHWGNHAKDGGAQTTAMVDLALEFLRDEDKLASASQAMQVTDRRHPGYSARYDDGVTGLHMVASFGLANLAKHLLNDSQEVDSRDMDGRTALHRAAENGHNDVVVVLLEHGADVYVEEDLFTQTPLHLAALNGHGDVVKTLLDHDAPARAKDADGWMAIHVAAWTGNEEVMKVLLDKTDADGRTEDKMTALHCAAAQGHLNIAQLLIRAGADVDAKDEDNWTPLHWASKKRHDIMRPRMLSLKNESSTLLRQFFAFQEEVSQLVHNEGLATVKRTLDFWQNKLAWLPGGIQLNIDGGSGYGEIMAALQMTSDIQNVVLPWPVWGNIWEDILGSKKNNRKEDDKDKPPAPARFIFAIQDELTAINCSTECGHEAVARLLIKHGADIEERCNADAELQWPLRVKARPTALHLAAFSGHEAMVQLLLKHGADIEAVTDSSKAHDMFPWPHALWTALHCGVASGSQEVVQLLFDHGANAHKLCPLQLWNVRFEMTSLHIAVILGHADQVELLLSKEIDVDTVAELIMEPKLPPGPEDEEKKEEQGEGDGEKSNEDTLQPARIQMTALYLSVLLARDDLTATLLKNQANLGAQLFLWIGPTEFNLSVLHVAALRRRASAVQLLLESGADARQKMNMMNDNAGVRTRAEVTLLHFSALCHDEKLSDVLLKYGGDVNESLKIDVRGWRPPRPDTEHKDDKKHEEDTKKEDQDGTKDRGTDDESEGNEREKDEIWSKVRWDRLLTRTANNFAALLGDELAETPFLNNLVQNIGTKNDAVYDLHLGLTPLAVAVLRKNEEAVRVFINHDVAVNEESFLTVNTASIRFTPLHIAALKGSKDIAQELLDAGADIYTVLSVALGEKLHIQVSALHLAAVSGNEELVRLLLNRGSELDKRCLVNENNDSVLTALHLATVWGRQAVVSVLLEKGANSTQMCQLKLGSGLDIELTMLHLAALSGNMDIVKIFLDKQHDAQALAKLHCYKLHAQFTVLHLATLWDHGEVVEELLKDSQSVHAKCFVEVESWATVDLPVLHVAAFAGSIAVLDKLVEAGVDVLQRVLIHGDEVSTELTALHVAALSRQKEMVKHLLDLPGMDIHAKIQAEIYGMQVVFTLLHMTMFWGTEMAVLLLDKGFDVDARFLVEGEDTHAEFTTLHLAVALRKKRLVLSLLNRGADADARVQVVTDEVNIELSALHLAVTRRSADMVLMLTSTEPLDAYDHPWMDSDSESNKSSKSSYDPSSYSRHSRSRSSSHSSFQSSSRPRSPSGSRSSSRSRGRSPRVYRQQRRRDRDSRRAVREQSQVRSLSSSPTRRSPDRPRHSRSRSVSSFIGEHLGERQLHRSKKRTGTSMFENLSEAAFSALPHRRHIVPAIGSFAAFLAIRKNRSDRKETNVRPSRRRRRSPSTVVLERAVKEEEEDTEQLQKRISVADTNAMLMLNVGSVRIQLTALHMAAALFRRTNMMQLLLKDTTDPNPILKVESTDGYSLKLTPLHIVVLRKSKAGVQCLVGAGADIETVLRAKFYNLYAEISSLQMVTVVPHWEIAQFLLGHNASAEAKHPFGFNREFQAEVTLLLLVALSRQEDIAGLAGKGVRIHAKAPAKIQLWLHSESSALEMAIKHINEDLKNLYSQYGFEEAMESGKHEPWVRKAILMIASALAQERVADLALTRITDINETVTAKVHIRVDAIFGVPMQADVDATLDVDLEATMSGLHVAASLGNADMVSMLIGRGASIEKRCEITVEDMMRAQLSALHLAALGRRANIIEKLVEERASVHSFAYIDIDRTVRAGAILPHLAALLGRDRISRLFVRNDEDNINIKIHAQLTPLHFAVLAGDVASTMGLLENREERIEAICIIQIQAKTSNIDVDMEGQVTPLHLAAWAGQVRLIETLLKVGTHIDAPIQIGGKATLDRVARVSRKIQAGGTALHLAAGLGQAEVVQLLIDNGAQVTLKSQDGRTAQEWAEERGHVDVSRLLAQAGDREGGKTERRRRRERLHDIFVKGNSNATVSEEDSQSLEHSDQGSGSEPEPRKYRQEGLGNLLGRWIVQRAQARQGKLQGGGEPNRHVDEEVD